MCNVNGIEDPQCVLSIFLFISLAAPFRIYNDIIMQCLYRIPYFWLFNSLCFDILTLENEIDFFIELGNQIPISTGQILGTLGILLLKQSYQHIKIILTIS